MFLLLPDFSSVAWDSSDSLWDIMTFYLAWPTQKASVLSCDGKLSVANICNDIHTPKKIQFLWKALLVHIPA